MSTGALYFLDSKGNKRMVKNPINKDDVMCAIHAYVKELNPNFEIYYIRSWSTDEGRTITYDVGSHTEFFKWKEGNK